MSDVLVRGLEDDTLKRLRARAKRHNRSLQAEIRTIVEQAAARDAQRERAVLRARKLRQRLQTRTHSDSTPLVREDRDR